MTDPAPGARVFTLAAELDADGEWLEADGLGGFASGPVLGPRTRRYHALLLSATAPPSGRMVLVNGVEAVVRCGDVSVPLATNRYLPDVLYPDGVRHVASFSADPWPCWVFDLGGGTSLVHEVFVAPDTAETVLRWSLRDAAAPWRLEVRPLLTGRDYHALHRENAAFDFSAQVQGGNVGWRPYPGLPAVAALSNGVYRHAPEWFRNLRYDAERARGLDDVEDVASPGVFTWDLLPARVITDPGIAGTPPPTPPARGGGKRGTDSPLPLREGTGEGLVQEPQFWQVGMNDADAVLVLRAGDGLGVRAAAHAAGLTAAEGASRRTAQNLDRAADSYLIDRGRGRTILAGFPWFTDWGRDTFIALRGLALARGRFAEAFAILDGWAATVSEGMVPNRFVDTGDAPEFNAVDASLWFIVAGYEALRDARAAGFPVSPAVEDRLLVAWQAILSAYAAGTRFRIGADSDGLLRAGVPGLQLTWMDAKLGDRVVTPRIGKPVEVQALWINALRIAGDHEPRWRALEAKARATFARRFTDPANGGLFDVVDIDHVPGTEDARVRPNQIFAVGGLPFPLLDGPAARAVVDQVERTLLTPMGLRSLAPSDPEYRGVYGGDPRQRDGAYHQGTVWPWLMGPFVEAWLAVHADRPDAKAEARARFLGPLQAHLRHAGIGHVSEIADGDAPHTPRGCPFQAWSMGEMLRIARMVEG